MKAIKITTENRDMLAGRFFIEKWEYDQRLPLDFWFVTKFGPEDTHYDLLTEVNFNLAFNIVGDIEHGFKAIEYK